MRYSSFLLIIAALFSLYAASASAQRNPPMDNQIRDAEKEDYFAAFSELKRIPVPESQRKAYEAAIEYLKRFEGERDPDAKIVRQFVNEYERTARHAEIFSTYNSKNYAKVFELGDVALERDKEDFFVLSMLVQAGFDRARAGDTSANDATVGYARRAIQLADAAKITKPNPFDSVEYARGYLNAAVGTLLKDTSPKEAALAYRKAVQSKSTYRTDPLTYHRLGSAILRGEFAQLSKEYNDKYLNQPPSAAQQTILRRINKLVAQSIDAYARAYALADPARPVGADEPGPRPQFAPEFRTRILEQLTALYKGSHDNSDAGLKELIAGVLSKPLPE